LKIYLIIVFQIKNENFRKKIKSAYKYLQKNLLVDKRKTKSSKKTIKKSQIIKTSSSNLSNNSYIEFLKNHKRKDDENLTHTMIGSTKNGVYSDSYCIPPEDLPEFYRLYENHVFVKKNEEYLTDEKQM
jgi:hypothetical protein